MGLGEVRARSLWMAAPAFGIGMYFTFALGREVPGWVPVVHLAAHISALAVVCLNRSLPGMRAIGLGLVLNAAVIGLNGGLMPESPETLHVNHPGVALQSGQHIPKSKNVLLERSETRLWWLSDILVAPPGVPLRVVASVGDVIMAAGLLWLVQAAMTSGGCATRNANAPEPLHTLSRW